LYQFGKKYFGATFSEFGTFYFAADVLTFARLWQAHGRPTRRISQYALSIGHLEVPWAAPQFYSCVVFYTPREDILVRKLVP